MRNLVSANQNRPKVKRNNQNAVKNSGPSFFGFLSKSEPKKAKRRGARKNDTNSKTKIVVWTISSLLLLVVIVVGSSVQFVDCEPGFRIVHSYIITG